MTALLIRAVLCTYCQDRGVCWVCGAGALSTGREGTNPWWPWEDPPTPQPRLSAIHPEEY